MQTCQDVGIAHAALSPEAADAAGTVSAVALGRYDRFFSFILKEMKSSKTEIEKNVLLSYLVKIKIERKKLNELLTINL